MEAVGPLGLGQMQLRFQHNSLQWIMLIFFESDSDAFTSIAARPRLIADAQALPELG